MTGYLSNAVVIEEYILSPPVFKDLLRLFPHPLGASNYAPPIYGGAPCCCRLAFAWSFVWFATASAMAVMEHYGVNYR